ncbi:MAG: type II toxin-antitoxin system Phd/YefM family antitoxin [Myxococcales bacterium]|nr:type II toxin-antitoxin system Phd/YefM family antitoxin [Myxococcales bacterium]
MGITSDDLVPLGQVRARLRELVEEARDGHEKIVTRNGVGYVAIIDARRLDHYHRLERAHIHLTLLDEAERAWDDVEAGRVKPIAALRTKFKRRR